MVYYKNNQKFNVNKLAILLGFFILFGCTPAEHKPMSQGPRPVLVVGDQVIQKDVTIYVDTIGNANSQEIVEIRPQVIGKLLVSHVKQGQFVHKGDLLYEIESGTMQASFKRAEAVLLQSEENLKFSKKKEERYTDLVKKEYVSQLQYDQLKMDVLIAESQVAIDKAELALAKINLDYCKIQSPIDGRVGQCNVPAGNNISPSDLLPLNEIRQISPMEVAFSIPQAAFQEIKACQEHCALLFEVTLPEQNENSFKGLIHFIDNHFDKDTGTIQIKGLVPNEKNILWPNQFVNVRIALKNVKDAILIPLSAVSRGQKGNFVFVIKDDTTVEMRPVTLGNKLDEFWLVESGLNPGEKIVTDGLLNLRHGMNVILANQTKSPSLPEEN